MVKRVQSSTEQVSSATLDLTNITVQTNTILIRQRSETELIASAVTEMSATAQSVAENAAEAAKFAEKADQQAEEGNHVVENYYLVSVRKHMLFQNLVIPADAGIQGIQCVTGFRHPPE